MTRTLDAIYTTIDHIQGKPDSEAAVAYLNKIAQGLQAISLEEKTALTVSKTEAFRASGIIEKAHAAVRLRKQMRPNLITPIIGDVYIIKHTSGLRRAEYIHQLETKKDGRSRIKYQFRDCSNNRTLVLASRARIIRSTEL